MSRLIVLDMYHVPGAKGRSTVGEKSDFCATLRRGQQGQGGRLVVALGLWRLHVTALRDQLASPGRFAKASPAMVILTWPGFSTRAQPFTADLRRAFVTHKDHFRTFVDLLGEAFGIPIGQAHAAVRLGLADTAWIGRAVNAVAFC